MSRNQTSQVNLGRMIKKFFLSSFVVFTFIAYVVHQRFWGLRPGELMFDIVMSNETGQTQFRSQQVFQAHGDLTQLAVEIAKSAALTQLSGHSPKTTRGAS